MAGETYDILAGAERATIAASRTFITLDGLRGVAAVAVMIWHMPGWQPLPSAYLAVDLFFMLSGFVIAYRYDRKIGSALSGRRFMLMRLIRLYPLYLLGTAIGALWALALLVDAHAGAGGYGVWMVKVVLALFAIPKIIGHGSVFPFDIPAWSLFYEFVVNAVYGFFLRHLTSRRLTIVAAGSAALLAALSLYHGNLHLTATMPNFIPASVRAVFGFFAGVLLFRAYEAGRLPQLRVSPILIAAALVALLALPSTGLAGAIVTPIVVVVAFPVLLVAGIANEPAGRIAGMMTWLGLVSFPLYAIHQPILAVLKQSDVTAFASQNVVNGVAIVVLPASAWIALKVYDGPVRRRLTDHAKRRLAAKAPRAAILRAT